MKKYFYILGLLTLSFQLNAQISFEAGGVAFETDLHEINAQAELDFGKFKVDIAGGYNIDEKKIEYMHTELSMDAVDIYIACEIGRISDNNIDNIISIYSNNKSQGWGHIAKLAGIKPGSDEFHALKRCTNNYYGESNQTGQSKSGKKNKKNK